MSPAGILAGGTAYRLPEGASATGLPVLRPLPRGHGTLSVGLLGGAALPAWILPGTRQPASAWVLLPGQEGASLLGGDLLLNELPPEALPVPQPAFPPSQLRLARRVEPAEQEETPAAPPAPGGFRLILSDGVLDLPFGALDRLLPMPALHPMPDAPPGMRGMAWTAVGAVLVLGTDAPEEEGEAATPLLAVILSSGRRIGLGCRSVVPLAQAPGSLPEALLSPALLAAAPLVVPPAEALPVRRRSLLVARAAGAAFALFLEDVAAIIPPMTAGNRRDGAVAGIAAHRGDVLPVLDAGQRLGRAPVLADGRPVPMIRLPGAHPAALAVSAVIGLQPVPEADIAPLAGTGLVAAMARVDGPLIPILRARALLAPLQGGHGV
ncbi:chemotaxis protein CheW [Roseomonas sp. SSH11]|uniref:Chemotaxis protein CheW n=1 Tax=Pararoseomonas baculiformis TaxID=2820812 RepID=A0ABS4AGF9_9PROT|nr:chemotaxis protein CheW [Pararoseomonas baculiformis]MBP0446086.1 chemotaxis protein CheW [Pararoseomonas baculiformis]